jgi:hypothetical protein
MMLLQIHRCVDSNENMKTPKTQILSLCCGVENSISVEATDEDSRQTTRFDMGKYYDDDQIVGGNDVAGKT